MTRLAGRTPLLRLQSDEKLVALVRRDAPHAFEVLVSRYQTRLLAFCRHMLGSTEDAEDVLQEVLAAAYTAMRADERPIAVKPWLYRIARNRALNHLRRTRAVGQDDMDVHLAEFGASTADQAHRREEFRLLLDDVSRLAETQRTALVLREMEHLSYEQIADAMETTVPSVKSLLVRARVGLAEAAEARALTCDEVREELGEAAEGLVKVSAPVRRHAKECELCHAFSSHLRHNNRALAAVLPLGPLVVLKQFLVAHLGGAAAGGGTASTGGAAAGASAGVAAAGAAAGAGAGAGAGVGAAGGLVSAGLGAVGTKAAAGVAAVALVGAGAVEVRQIARPDRPAAARLSATPPPAQPVATAPASPASPSTRRRAASRPASALSGPRPAAAAKASPPGTEARDQAAAGGSAPDLSASAPVPPPAPEPLAADTAYAPAATAPAPTPAVEPAPAPPAVSDTTLLAPPPEAVADPSAFTDGAAPAGGTPGEPQVAGDEQYGLPTEPEPAPAGAGTDEAAAPPP